MRKYLLISLFLFSGVDKMLMADMDTDGIVEYPAGVLGSVLLELAELTVKLNKLGLSELINKMKKHYREIEKNEISFPKKLVVKFNSLLKKNIMLQNAEENNKEFIQNLINTEMQLNEKEIMLKEDIIKGLPLSLFLTSERFREITNARDGLNQATKAIEKQQYVAMMNRE